MIQLYERKKENTYFNNLQVFIKEHPPLDQSIPGPGSYNANMKAVEKNNGAFSLKPRTAFQSSMIINFSSTSID